MKKLLFLLLPFYLLLSPCFAQATDGSKATGNSGGSGSASIQYAVPRSGPPLGFGTMASVTANVICNADNTGNATASPYNGTPPYTYAWSNGGTATVSTNNPTGAILSAGSYTVTVTDALSNIATASVTITQTNAVTISWASVVNITCHGDNNGQASSSVSGGNSPYTYAWSNGGTKFKGINLSATTYTLTVTDKNGCNATATVSLTQPTSALSETIGSVTDLTCNHSANGSATSTPLGGTGAYTYLWTPTGSTLPTVATLPAGTAICQVLDANGCKTTASVSIIQPAIISGTSIHENATCYGYNTGTATITPTGGSGTYTSYAWSPNVSSTTTASGLTAGSYMVTISDNNGCTGTVSVSITQPTEIFANASITANVSCLGGNNGSVLSAPSGGTRPYTYSWTGGATTANVSGLSGGTYNVTVYDLGGCSASASVTITQPGQAIAARWWELENVTCYGANNAWASSQVYGGTMPYTYLWSDGGTKGNATGLSQGTYSLTVTDVNGCTTSISINLTQPAAAVSETVTLVNNLTCNHSANGSATSLPAGGTGAYTYLWAPGGSTLATPTTLPAGTAICQVLDANGCKTTASVTLTQPTVISGASTHTNATCNGYATGTATITPTGGTTPYTSYAWSPNTNSTVTASGLSAGIYTVTITDNNGCTGTVAVSVTQPAVIALPAPTYTCVTGGKGTITALPTGGTAPYTYNWSNGTTIDTTTTVKTETFTAGTYTVSVTDKFNCPSATASVVTSSCPPELELESPDKGNTTTNGAKFAEVTVYPNPSNGQFTVESSAVSGKSVEVYNMLGEKVYSQFLITNSQFLIDLSNQASGIYLLRIIDNNGTLVGQKKLVKTN